MLLDLVGWPNGLFAMIWGCRVALIWALHDIDVDTCGVGDCLRRSRVYVEVQGAAMSNIDLDMDQQFRGCCHVN